MVAIAGSILEVALDGRVFAVAADADSQRKLGGFENEAQANGDGSARMVKTRVTWMASDLTLEMDDTRDDQEFLQALQDRKDWFPIAVTYASGETYQGQGGVVGEVQTSSQSATASVSLAGPGELTRQI